MTNKIRRRTAAAAAVVLAAIGASVAYAHGNTDQMNDPATGSGWYCAQEGPERLFQGFLPTKRQLASFDVRVFRRLNFPPAGMTLRGIVHTGTGSGPVLGQATAFLGDGDEDNVMVHFEFSPPVTLEPQGTFAFELAYDVSGIRWMGRNDNPYAAATSFDCDGATPDSAIDFNFVSYTPPDGAAPDTVIDAGPGTPPVTRARTTEFTFRATDDLSYAPNLVMSCDLDGRPHNPCASPVSVAGLGDGRHRFTIRATDEAGQTDATPATRSWIVDGTAPSRPRVTGQRRPSAGRATYRFSARDAVDRPAQLSFRCALDSRRLRSCATQVTKRLSRGNHVLRVAAVDRAGNISKPAVVRIVRA
jgi:hypothetical protein